MRGDGQKEVGRVPSEPGSHPSGHAACGVDGASRFDPSRVLFLDMDGVVLSGQELWRTRNNRHMPPEKIALIKEVCERSGAVIVVSSTWRYTDDTATDLRAAGLPVHADWRTPMARREGSIFIGATRGWEIHRWLARHPEVRSFAIVDDDSDMLPEQFCRFVQTPFATGVDRDHVERLIAILSDSDRSGEAIETPESGSTSGESAGPQDIAKPLSETS